MADVVYMSGRDDLHNAVYNYESTAIYVALTNGYTPNATTHNVWTDVTNEATGTGYTAGGQQLTGVTVTRDDANKEVVVVANDPVWATSTISADGCVFYFNPGAGNKTLIAFEDFGEVKSSSGDNFTIDIGPEGFAKLS